MFTANVAHGQVPGWTGKASTTSARSRAPAMPPTTIAAMGWRGHAVLLWVAAVVPAVQLAARCTRRGGLLGVEPLGGGDLRVAAGCGVGLLVLIEGADMLVPQEEIARMSEADRKRVAILRDWLCDPGFMNAKDTVILLAESRGRLSQEVAKLPQLLEVEIPSPDKQERG